MSTTFANRFRLWRETAGGIDLGTYLLFVTIVALGMIVGAATVRDQLVQELGDLGLALENIDQSYSMTINGETSEYEDDDPGDDPADQSPGGISIVQPSSEEGDGSDDPEKAEQ